MKTINHKILLIIIFLLCLSLRVYWMSEKHYPYGDENYTISISYNNVGNGENTFDVDRFYSLQQLKQMWLVDDVGGLQGWWNDIVTLWTNNNDASHASTYYMLFRTTLIGVDSPDMDTLLLRGYCLNLVIFALSFCFLWILLNRIVKNQPYVTCALMALAFLTPTSVSASLLLREYQFAECLMTLFALFALRLYEQIESRERLLTFKNVLAGAALTALLVSAGYFNSFFALFIGIFLLVKSISDKQKSNITYFAATAILSVVFSVLLYKGFFNFIYDIRTEEVTDKLQGADFFGNILSTILFSIKSFCIYLLGVFAALWTIYAVAKIIYKKIKFKPSHRIWLLYITFGWFVVTSLLSPWKDTRYIAPCVPLLMSLMFLLLYDLTIAANLRKWIWLPAVLTVPFFIFQKQVLGFKGESYWPENAKIVYAFGPDAPSKNRITHLIPHIKDNQLIYVFDDFSKLPADTAVYVSGPRKTPVSAAKELQNAKGLVGCYNIDQWQAIYIYNRKAVGQ